MNGFTVQAYFTSASTLKDRGMSLRFTTQELSNDEQIAVIDMCHQMGYVLFKANEIQDSEIPPGDADAGQKTPSKRLRDIIFVYYKQLGKKEDFEVFYRNQMERIINKYKAVLD